VFKFEVRAKLLSSLSNRCPATMLADSRIDRVIGRMMLLTSSIITMKFIKAVGVPVGTMCVSMLSVLLDQPKIIIAIHIDIAIGREIMMWEVGVNVNGESAMKLDMRRMVKMVSIIFVVPLLV